MFLWWGEDMIQFYNDAYRPSLGNNGKHPSALGAKGQETWPEIWDIISPLHRQVENTGEATWMENQLVPIYRNGRLEDVYWTFSYSSVLDDHGKHGGILVTCVETTDAVLAHRKIEESQQDLLHLFEESPVAIATLSNDDDLVFQFANSFYATLVGRQPEQIIGKPLLVAVPELKGQGFDGILKQVIRTGKPFVANEIAAAILRSGRMQTIYVDLAYQPRIDIRGNISGVLVVATDVTQQATARKKIEESESRFRNMVEQAPVAITLTRGMDVVIESINAPMLQLMNKSSKEEVIGKKMLEVLPELEGQPALQTVLNVQKTGIPFRGDEQPVDLLVNGQLQRYYFNFSYTPIMEEGTVAAVLHVALDVSQQVLTRRKIEESEGRFRLLANASPILIWMLDPTGSCVYVNNKTLDFLDTSREEMATLGWQPFVHPNDLGPTTHALTEAIQHRKPYEMEHRLRHNDGEYRWVLSQAIPAFDANGDVFAYVGSSIDIHDSKQSREELLTALEQTRLSKEAAEMGTFDMDLIKGTMHWDDRCRTLFGISHQQPVTYEEDFVPGLHPDDRERISKLIDRLFIKSESNGDYDVEYRTIGAEDGVTKWVRAKGKVYFNKEEKPVRFIGSVLDITEKVTAVQQIERLVEERTRELAEANATLKNINKELQRSNQNLEEFAHAASHDLKEPVRKIHFFTSQLKHQLSKLLKEGEISSLNRIERASERMRDLIDDLLLYSHVNQRPRETETVDLNQIMQSVCEELELDISDKQAVVKFERLPVVKGYRRQLQQLFQNLISNALKYSKDDLHPCIEISTTQTTENGKSYQLVTVRDNGIGFAPEYADKIFQMFTRLHAKNEYSGTGVGLSIVKKVVENHNGFILVQSAPGQGSAFNIYLPLEPTF
jgi:PAS domain S-box-containing protein